MSSIPSAENSATELQRMDANATAAAGAAPAVSGWSERAKWLLTSPNPPPAWQELYISMKESLFPRARDKQPGQQNRCFLFLQSLFPILKWGKNYKATKFKNDLMAGLTLASLCIPQSIGYANLAKLDPQYGLYTSVVPPLIYALMGSSREIAIGPVAVVSLLLSATISKVVVPLTDPTAYRRMVFTVTFFTGIFQALFGILRLGFLVDFLSHAAIVGFMGGAAIVIGLQQLKGLLGIKSLSSRTDVVSVVHSVVKALHQEGKKKKKLFWLPAIAPLLSVVLSTLIVYLTKADKHGVKIVKHFNGGINPISMKQLNFGGEHLGESAKIGLILILFFSDVTLSSSLGSFSRTAVNFSSGVETAVSNIIMAITVLISLLLFTKLLYYTPLAILASIILSALPGLIDVHEAYNIWKVDKLDFLVCFGAFSGVLFGSVEIGLLVASFGGALWSHMLGLSTCFMST
ncbi:low affinity sulfate transporter 3-like [Dorcoceras hygrometricum]|uniref:Low affinity sulfate transporter 3-like n=1 Tax=Dorcoceras hygrometricum TaxID=472368 RepID=A0A2Z7CGI8_9LAMI|nr:low affinity sulfate transporter 3-like [Dorcoceras hygrometricum]